MNLFLINSDKSFGLKILKIFLPQLTSNLESKLARQKANPSKMEKGYLISIKN